LPARRHMIRISKDGVVDQESVCSHENRVTDYGHIAKKDLPIVQGKAVQILDHGIRKQKRVPRDRLVVPNHDPARWQATDDRWILTESCEFYPLMNQSGH